VRYFSVKGTVKKSSKTRMTVRRAAAVGHGQLKLRLFGVFEARLSSGCLVELSTRKCEALLAFLALYPDEPQFRDRLATLFWSGSGDEQARHSLRQALATLRRALGSSEQFLQTSRDKVKLECEGVDVDVLTFRQLLEADDAAALARAADLYAGPLLDGMTLHEEPFDDWLAQERARLQRSAVGLLLRLSELSANDETAMTALSRALDLDPTCEEAHRRLMRAHIDAGRYNAAVLQFKLCAESLQRDLDTTPEPQTLALHERAVAKLAQGTRAPPADTSPAASSGERKHVTVLCAALFSTSPLAESGDPEVAFEALGPALEEMRACAERAGGTTISDERDALTIVFGAPVALENHAASACRAALEMSTLAGARANFPFRSSIAIDSGEVVVRANRDGLRREDVFGHCVRRAVRLATSGRIRAIAATEPVVELASRSWRFAHVDAISLDDTDSPIQLQSPTEGVSGSTNLEPFPMSSSPFVGRQPELRLLRAALTSTAQENGQLVAVVGGPGIGKSRLFQEFLRGVPGAWTAATCAGDAQRADAAYLPIATLMRSCLGVAPGGTVSYDAATRAILAIDPALEHSVPALLSLLDFDVRDPAWIELEPAQKRHRIIDAVALLCRRKAARKPLILVVEDLHWLDAASHRVLERLVETLPTARILLLVNYRPGFTHEWGGLSFYRQVYVAPFSAPASTEFVARLVGDDVSLDSFRQRLIDDTGGNPFFIEECVRALRLRANRDPARFAVPETVQAVIAARIDQLEPVEKWVLQIAAVAGNDVSYAVLSSVGEFSQETLRKALRRLQAAEFLYETDLSASGSYRFQHALTNEVAYATLLQQTRRELHGRIVATMERTYAGRLDEQIDALAYHSVRASLLESAAAYCARAGQRALARGANRTAAGYFGEALSALTDLPQTAERAAREIDLRFEMRNTLFVLGERDAIWDHLRRAEALAERIDDPLRRGYAALQIGAWFWQKGQPLDACAAGERALAIAQEHGDVILTALAWYRIGLGRHASGSYREATEDFTRATALLDERGDRMLVALGGYPYAFCCSFLCWSLAELGEFDAAEDWGRRGWQLAADRNHAYSQTVVAFGLGHSYVLQGRFDEALPILEKGFQQCQIAEVRAAVAWVASLLGLTLVATGRKERGFRLLREALTDEPNQLSLHRALLELRLAQACLIVEDWHEASLAAHRGHTLALQHGERGYAAWAELFLADVARESGERAALEHYERAIELASELDLAPLLVAARSRQSAK
jgi:DNA-binding SARP family transcriptional activator